MEITPYVKRRLVKSTKISDEATCLMMEVINEELPEASSEEYLRFQLSAKVKDNVAMN